MAHAPSPSPTSLDQAIARSHLMVGHRPVPLVATRYDIAIRGGLADVTTTRTFRNDEATSIEATLTFPLPVHAVLYGLEARIGGRTLRAIAQARTQARATYEAAIDAGKTAVLHEELIKGVHMLSLGHIAPGTEIAITLRFAVALARLVENGKGDRTVLRLPTTVGDIYGNSGLPDSDDLVHGGPALLAPITVTCDSGQPILLGGGKLEAGADAVMTGSVALDAPIAIEVKGWSARVLHGLAADGRRVALRIEPAPAGTHDLDVAVLVDHSGSMNSPCAHDGHNGGGGLTKHAAALLGLSEAADDLRASDRLHLWEFDDTARDLGPCTGATWRKQLHKLSGPAGGTEIGRAIDAALSVTPQTDSAADSDRTTRPAVRDIIVITDGKSHALDVQRLARTGARFTVVLIGEDSLEANVGHLAALTGGEILVPTDADVAQGVRAALRSIRTKAGDPREAMLRRSGMMVHASWTPTAEGTSAADGEGRAVAAYAASLLLIAVGEDAASRLAEAEGLVTHLTSLVLVDDADARQAGLPATRKVALPSPRTMMPMMAHTRLMTAGAVMSAPMAAPAAGASATDGPSTDMAPAPMRRMANRLLGGLGGAPKGPAPAPPAPSPQSDASHSRAKRVAVEPSRLEGGSAPASGLGLTAVAVRIAWGPLADTLAAGDLSGLPAELADPIREATANPRVAKAARRLGLTAVQLVIGLLARCAAAQSSPGQDRHAARVDRAIFGKAVAQHFGKLQALLGLPADAAPTG